MPATIGPFTNVPAPGDGVTSPWAQQLTQRVVDYARGPIRCLSTARPAGEAGLTIFETDTKRLRLHDGTNWIIMREPAQTTGTFTLRQNSTGIASTPQTPSTYRRSDGYCDVYCGLTVGGAGAAGPIDIAVANVPGPISAGYFGAFSYYDASFGSYTGTAGANGSVIFFSCHNSNSTLGQNPSFAVAATDTIAVTLRYRMANLYE